jgi:hypothetical protein
MLTGEKKKEYQKKYMASKRSSKNAGSNKGLTSKLTSVDKSWQPLLEYLERGNNYDKMRRIIAELKGKGLLEYVWCFILNCKVIMSN